MGRKFDPRGFIGDLCFVSLTPIPKDGDGALERTVTSYDAVRKKWTALREDGSLCSGWTYVAPIPPTKPAKPAPKAKWKPRTIEIPSKATRPVLVDLVHECVAEINQLGTENSRLKNQLAKLKDSK